VATGPTVRKNGEGEKSSVKFLKHCQLRILFTNNAITMSSQLILGKAV